MSSVTDADSPSQNVPFEFSTDVLRYFGTQQSHCWQKYKACGNKMFQCQKTLI